MSKRPRPKAADPAPSEEHDDVESAPHDEGGEAPPETTSQGPAPRVADPAQVLDFAIQAARLVRDDKCEEVVLLDVRNVSQVTDFILIGSGTSERQMRSVLDHVEELGGTMGMPLFRSNADDRSLWLLADFVHVVVHLFEPATRAHYDLEMMWGDVPRVAWERPDQVSRDHAGLGERPTPRPGGRNA